MAEDVRLGGSGSRGKGLGFLLRLGLGEGGVERREWALGDVAGGRSQWSDGGMT